MHARPAGRIRIATVAAALKLSAHHVEAAQRLFMLAMQHNFIQGRRTQNVVAACLYIVCRREHTARASARRTRRPRFSPPDERALSAFFRDAPAACFARGPRRHAH